MKSLQNALAAFRQNVFDKTKLDISDKCLGGTL